MVDDSHLNQLSKDLSLYLKDRQNQYVFSKDKPLTTRNIQKIIDNIPDVLILNHTDYITNNNDKYDVIYNNLSKQKDH